MVKFILTLATTLLALSATAQNPAQMEKSDKLFAQGVELYNASKYQEAIPYFEQSDGIDKTQLEEGDTRRDYSCQWLASCYYKLGNEARAKATSPFYMIPPVDRRLTTKSDSLTNVANILALEGRTKEARDLFGQCADIEKKVAGEKSLFYANTLMNCAMCDNNIGNNALAAQEVEVALNIYKNYFDQGSEIYAQVLLTAAICLGENDEKSEALIATQKAMEYLGENEELLNMMSIYSDNFIDQVNYNTKALEKQLESTPTNTVEYAMILKKLFSAYSIIGNVKRSEECRKKALEVYDKVIELNTKDVHELTTQAAFYESINEHEKALEKAIKAIELGNKSPQFFKDDLINAYSIAANSNYCIYSLQDTNDPKIQLKLLESTKYTGELMNLMQGDINQNHPEYLDLCIENLNLITRILLMVNEPVKALNFAQMHYSYVYKYKNDEEDLKINALWNLGNTYLELGDTALAIKAYDEIMPMEQDFYGENSINNAITLRGVATNLFTHGYYDSSIKYIKATNDALPKAILKSFTSFTSHEREQMWGVYNNWYDNLNMFSFMYPRKDFISAAYDGVLFTKGLLLGVDQELKKAFSESENPTLHKLYNDYLKNLKSLDNFQALNSNIDKDEYKTKLKQLKTNIYSQEKKLLELSGAQDIFNRNFMITWKQVQNALGTNDVAVDFNVCGINDNNMYFAFVLKKGMETPVLIPLFEEKQLKAKQSNSNNYMAPAHIYKQEQMASELIWKQLAQYLDGAENIYFAPSGELYNIAIESLPDWDNSTQLMSDRWKGLCRVSSTREIAINRDRQPINSSVTYGGLKYDMNADLLTADSKKYGSQASSLETSPLMAMVKGQSGDTWRDMPITLDEAASVHESLNKAGVDDTPYLEEAGTEASFKALSGQHKNMMFLSTHGFFWNTDEAKKHRREHTLQFVSLGNEDRHQSVEDMAMTRSGLLFSGANYAWQGNELPDGVDDGFLTAKEISQLDLRGLGLVVLSACQTGLGDVSGEGVFGLQRGFKKAGAQSILMSLWEVNAYSTKLLMTEFCKNVFEKKMNKRDALRAAQETVKNFTGDPESLATKGINITSHGVDKDKKYKKTKQQTEETITQPASDNHPFAHPYYWAGFILLDALD